MRSLNVALLVLTVTASSFAAVPHLSMPADQGGDAVTLSRLQVKVTIRGHLARTEYDLTFRSKLAYPASGDFVFPIPANGEVSDLGLYFNGRLRHAVAVDRVTAQKAYGETVHRRVDPALADWTDSRAFRMRLFPIPAYGEKQVRIACDEDLLANDYLLDLGFKQTLESYSVVIDDDGRGAEASGIPLQRTGNGWSASGTNAFLDAKVRVAADAHRDALIAWSERNHCWFASATIASPTDGPAWPPSAHVTLLWDASGSAVQQDAARLHAFLDAFLGRQLAWTSVTILPFHLRVEEPRYATPHDLWRTLDDIGVAGATNLAAALERIPEIAADLPQSRIVLVTDGIHSAGDTDAVRKAAAAIHRPLTIVNAAPRANDAFLSGLAATTGGVYLDLSRVDAQAAADRAMRRPVRTTLTSPQLFDVAPSKLASDGGDIAVAGRSATRPAVVTFAGRELAVRDVSDAGDLVRRAWARSRLRELTDRAAPPEEIAALGREQTMLTPRTSLIVLETARDYEMYGFPLPEDLAEESARIGVPAAHVGSAAWFLKGFVADSSGAALPGVTVTLTSDRGSISGVSDQNGMTWLPLPAAPTKGTVSAELAGFGSTMRTLPENPPSGQMIELVLRAAVSETITVTAAAPLSGDNATDSDSVVVSAHSSIRGPAHMQLDDLLASVAHSYENAPLAQRHALIDRIVQRIASLPASERFRYYAMARSVVGGDKSFHLRVAELLRADDRELAVRVLTDLAEQNADDASIVRIVARVADGWGFEEVSRALLMRALEAAPEQPQTWRELMLLAAKQGRKRDLNALVQRQKAIARDWRMTEVSQQIAVELARGGGDLRSDPNAHLTAELMWEGEYGYVDIHVVEPSGEEVTWNHDRSAYGGSLAGWNNWGYGPEVYENRSNVGGDYRIDVQYFSDDATNVSHETVAHLIVYAGGVRSDYTVVLSVPDERRTVTTVRLSGR